jgi:hypothetical protein
MNISKYIGKQLIFVEAGKMCLATLIQAEYGTDGFSAVFSASKSPSLSCNLHRIRYADEDAVSSWSESAVFGEHWEVLVTTSEFDYEQDYWQASFLWGGGFRIFLDQTFVERFISHDVSWLEEFFNQDDESEE